MILRHGPVDYSWQDEKDLTAYFRSKGLRWTIQRQMIVNLLREKPGHISAEEIHQTLVQDFPGIDISTIYRTLEMLCEIGMVIELSSKPKRFELIREVPHHHLICKICQQEYVLSNDIVDNFKKDILKDYSFTLRLEHLVVPGYCRSCMQKNLVAEEETANKANSEV